MIPPLPDQTPEREWGQPVNGLRIRSTTDRFAYRAGKDLIHVTFLVNNVSREPYPVTLMRDAQEVTDLTVIDPAGKEHFVPGLDRELPKRRSWDVTLRAGAVERVSAVLDPARVDGGLKPGRYRLRGSFRYTTPAGSPRPAESFRLESNEISFALLDLRGKWDAGAQAGPCSLSLMRMGDRSSWKPGDPPLNYAVVLNRLDADVRTLRFLGHNDLRMIYYLEITGPDGSKLLAPQPAAVPRLDSQPAHFMHAGLMFHRLDTIPVGKSLGERFCWDPSGQAERTGFRLERLIATPGFKPVPGTYRLRVVYQIPDEHQERYGNDPLAIRLVSNAIDLDIAGEPSR
ncbi:MAG: hypothetical protein K2R98_14300 [Gemmataceae bacterium]|nr:hypothetical protein [Gemmataceae bacterium]